MVEHGNCGTGRIHAVVGILDAHIEGIDAVAHRRIDSNRGGVCHRIRHVAVPLVFVRSDSAFNMRRNSLVAGNRAEDFVRGGDAHRRKFFRRAHINGDSLRDTSSLCHYRDRIVACFQIGICHSRILIVSTIQRIRIASSHRALHRDGSVLLSLANGVGRGHKTRICRNRVHHHPDRVGGRAAVAVRHRHDILVGTGIGCCHRRFGRGIVQARSRCPRMGIGADSSRKSAGQRHALSLAYRRVVLVYRHGQRFG